MTSTMDGAPPRWAVLRSHDPIIRALPQWSKLEGAAIPREILTINDGYLQLVDLGSLQLKMRAVESGDREHREGTGEMSVWYVSAE